MLVRAGFIIVEVPVAFQTALVQSRQCKCTFQSRQEKGINLGISQVSQSNLSKLPNRIVPRDLSRQKNGFSLGR